MSQQKLPVLHYCEKKANPAIGKTTQIVENLPFFSSVRIRVHSRLFAAKLI
jgi:hypothetical protein